MSEDTLQLTGTIDLEAAPAKGPPRIEILAYTGAEIVPAGMGPTVIDLAGLKFSGQIPVVSDHNVDLPGIIGHGTAALDGNNLIVCGQVVEATDASKQVLQLAKSGFQFKASVGVAMGERQRVQPGETITANGRTFTAGPRGILHLKSGQLKEISVLAIGADENTSVAIAASRGKVMSDNTDVTAEVLKAERDRLVANSKLFIKFGAGVADATVGELQARSISEGWDAAKVELELLRAAARAPADDLASSKVYRPSVSRANGPDVLQAALCMSAGCDEAFTGRHFDQPTMNAALSREMRGAGFHELLFATIRAAGKHATGHRVNDDTIRTAFEADRMLRAEGISMASLPGILSNVAGKLLLNAYQAIATTWQLVCSISIVNDFKLHSRYRLTADGTFDQVGAGGELKHGTLGEQAYGQQAKTYGKILSISREDLINDDLGAFGELPKVLGRNAAIALEKAVYTLLMGPGTFFSAGNNNYFAGATSNLQLSSLQTAEQMMLDAVDDAGYPILLQPVTLLVPTALKTTAFSLVHSTELVGTTTADVLKPSGNPFVGRLNPAASAWLNNANLTGYSALAWYLLGNPVDVAAMEVAFLNGLQYPTIQTAETDFSVLGIQLRCFHDFGVALQDPRGAVKSKGAA